MNHLLRHTTVFLALLTLLLTACGRSAPTHFYLLDSGQPPLTADSLPAASLSIAPVSVPDYLDRNGLVRRSDGQTRLEISELDIWAEPLGQGARRVLGEVLATRRRPAGRHGTCRGFGTSGRRHAGHGPAAGPLAAFPWRRGAGSRHLRSQRGCRHEQRQSCGGPEPSVAGTGRTSGRPSAAPPQGRTLATARFPIIRPPAGPNGKCVPPGRLHGQAGNLRETDPRTHHRTKKGRLEPPFPFYRIISRCRCPPRAGRAIPLPAVLSST